MTYDIVYREDGVMILEHAVHEDGTFVCGQPRYTGPIPQSAATPACPKCLQGLLDYIKENS